MPIVSAAIDTFLQSGALILDENGAASTPPLKLTGTIFTGGSATTTKPALLVEPAGTTSTGWSTSGTMIGANAPSGFTGNLADLQLNGASKFRVSSAGLITINNNVSIGNGAAATLSLDFNYAGGRRAVLAAPVGASSGLHFYFEDVIGWTGGSALAGGAADDLIVSRSAAGVLAINGASAGASLEVTEMTAPSAPATNKARIYAEDNGSGKTRLMVLFPTGAAQQIAIEP
jgi:hypothetical protein